MFIRGDPGVFLMHPQFGGFLTTCEASVLLENKIQQAKAPTPTPQPQNPRDSWLLKRENKSHFAFIF